MVYVFAVTMIDAVCSAVQNTDVIFFTRSYVTGLNHNLYNDVFSDMYTQQKSSAQMGFRVNPVLASNSCIQC